MARYGRLVLRYRPPAGADRTRFQRRGIEVREALEAPSLARVPQDGPDVPIDVLVPAAVAAPRSGRCLEQRPSKEVFA